MPVLPHLPADSSMSRELDENHRGEPYAGLAAAEASSPAPQNSEFGKGPDTKMQELLNADDFAAKEQVSEAQVLQVLVGQLVYKTEHVVVKALNQHLEEHGSAEGGFFYIYEAAARLSRLRRKGKVVKADEFQKHLNSFATKFGFSANAFNQWHAAMACKDMRYRMGYVVEDWNLNSVQNALGTESAILEPCKDAVGAMIIMGQRFNVL